MRNTGALAALPACALILALAGAQDSPRDTSDTSDTSDTREVHLQVLAAEDGTPLESALVGGKLSPRDGLGRPTLSEISARTDENGHARLAVAPGRVLLLELSVKAEGRAEVVARFELPAQGDVDLLNVDLRRLVSTRIRLADDTGDPIPGVRIWPRDCYSGRFAVLGLHEDVTGEDGRTGPLSLPEGEILTEMRGIPQGLRGSGWTQRYIEVTRGQDVEVVLAPAELGPARLITGVLQDHRGDPVADVHLVAYEEGRFFPVGSGQSGPDGRFRIVVAEGTGEVRLETYEEESRELAEDPRVRPGARDVTVRLAKPAFVHLQVVDADTGNPVEDFSVAALRVRSDRHQYIHGHRGVRLPGPHDGGVLVVDEVLRGENLMLVLPAEETGYLPSGFLPVTVRGPHTRVTVRLHRPSPFRVRVVDSEGAPMSGSTVTLVERMRPDPESSWACPIRGPVYGGNRLWDYLAFCEATTDENGLAVLAWQPWDRPCRLRVTGEAHVQTEVDAPEFEPGMEPIEVKVARAARIVGTADLDRLAEFGVGLYGVRGPATIDRLRPAIVLRDASTGELTEDPDGTGFPVSADGGFTCTGVRPGRLQLLFRYSAGSMRTTHPDTLAEVTVQSGQVCEVDVDLSRVVPAGIHGQVWLDGVKTQPRSLWFIGYGRDHLGRRKPMRSGGSFPVAFLRGEYRFAGLPPGDYVFRMTTVLGGREVELRTFDEVRLRPGEDRQLDLRFEHCVARVRLVAGDGETPVVARTVAIEPDGGLFVSDDRGWITVDPATARVMKIFAFADGVTPGRVRGLHYLDPQPVRTEIGTLQLGHRVSAEATLVVPDVQ